MNLCTRHNKVYYCHLKKKKFFWQLWDCGEQKLRRMGVWL